MRNINTISCVIYIMFIIMHEGATNLCLAANATIPAVLIFGDSIVDTGNNNQLTLSTTKANFRPYGENFEGGRPTGRFSDGKILSDLIAEALGVSDVVPAYLDPKLDPKALLTGVSFASAGSGFDPITYTLLEAIPVIPNQLQFFKEYTEKLKGVAGEERANQIIAESVYILLAGNNDIVTYFTIPVRQQQYNINSYTDLLVANASNFLQELYGLGARKFAVHSILPVGCWPLERTLRGGLTRDCSDTVNQGAALFNAKLSAATTSITQSLPGSKLIFVDIYNPILNITNNPGRFGLRVVEKGCCGTGLVETGPSCNQLSGTCPNASAYLYFDSVHPTESGYRTIVNNISPSYATLF